MAEQRPAGEPRENLQIPEIYKYDFEDPENKKPWLENNRADMDKYFNYGFNEETWKIHAADVLTAHAFLPGPIEVNQNNATYKRNKSLNFYLPHNLGGFADPTSNDLAHVNTYSEEVDLPQIKPKTVQQKNEFYAVVPNSQSPLSLQAAKDITITPDFQEILNQWEQLGQGKVL